MKNGNTSIQKTDCHGESSGILSLLKRFLPVSRRSRAARESQVGSLEYLEPRCLLSAITVNSVADSTSADNELTLREAIALVNHAGNANAALGRALTAGELAQVNTTNPFGTNDTVRFQGGVFADATPDAIALSNGELVIKSSVVIIGTGAEQLEISGNNVSRVFRIDAGTAYLAHFSIRDGLAQGGDGAHSEFGGGGGGGAGMGGGVFVNSAGTAVLQNLILADNQAVGGDGGGSGVPGAGTTGGVAGTSSVVDGSFGVGGVGGNGTTVNSASGTAGSNGSFAGGGGGGGGGGLNGAGTAYLPGAGGNRGATSDDLDSGDQTVLPGVGGGRSGHNGLDPAALFDPSIPAGVGGGGGGGAGLGGAVFVRAGGNLTIVDSHFAANQAIGGQPGRRGQGFGVGKGGSVFAMDTVSVNTFGVSFGHGSIDANFGSTPNEFPSNPATSVSQRQGLFGGTFVIGLPALTYVDGPTTPMWLGRSYLNPSVRNPGVPLNSLGDTPTTVTMILDRVGRGGLRKENASPIAIAVTDVDDNAGGLWVYDTGSGYQSLTTTPTALAIMSGNNNDFLVTSTTNGRQLQIIDSGAGGGDAVALEGNILTFRMDLAAGATAQDAIDLLQADLTLSAQFSAQRLRDGGPAAASAVLEAFGPVDFNNVSDSRALLLGGTDTLAFIADEDFDTVNGMNPAVTFRAWDGAAGTAGDFTDTTTNGGGTPFSTAKADAIVNISDPLQFDDGILFFPETSTMLVPTDSLFPYTLPLDIIPTSGSREFQFTLTGVGGVFASGVSVSSLHMTIKADGTTPFGYPQTRIGVLQFASTSSATTGPGVVSQTIFNSNVRAGNFTIEDTDSGPVPIVRSGTAAAVGATHFKVQDITGGTLFADAAFTTPVADGDFVSYGNGNVWLYFRPDANFNGDATFLVLDSTSASNAGLLTANPVFKVNEDTGPHAIQRSAAAETAGVTHFQVTGITGGKVYLDAGFTQQVEENEFLGYGSGTVELYFRPTNNFVGAAGFEIEDSIGDTVAGLQGSTSAVVAETDYTFALPQIVTVIPDTEVSIAPLTATVNEGNSGTTDFTFTVTRTDSTGDAGTTTVGYSVAGVEATADDFVGGVLPTGTVTFAPGETSKTVTIQVTTDSLVERDETFTVTLNNIPAGVDGTTVSALGTIVNDDSATLSIDDVTQSETNGATTFTFTVTLDATVDTAVGVSYDTASDSATTADGDYTANTGSALTFAANIAGPQTMTIDVTVNGDTKVELDEAFFVNLTNLQASGRSVTLADAQGRGTITNDDSATISINDVTRSETNGATTFTFTVSLDAAVDTALGVNYDTANDSATIADGDYTANTGSALTFAANTAGPQTMTIDVTVNGDTKVELDEAFFVNLTNLQAGGRSVTLADTQGRGTITNDDSATISINDVTRSETNGATTFTFTVSLDAAVDAALGVNYDTANDSATTADSDFTPNTGSALTFAANTAGPQTMMIDVTVNGDTKVELDEAFFVNLTNLQAAGRSVTLADAQGRGTIRNDDAATLSINDVTQVESNGATTFTFTVTLDAAVDTAVAVNHDTANDSATTGDSDFTSNTGGTLNFSANVAGPQTKTIDVTVNGDTKVELDEAFFVNLTNLQAAGRAVTINDAQGRGTIMNDDSATISINDVTQAETGGATTFSFNVSLSAPVDTVVSVNHDTADSTATTGDGDFTANTGNALNFTANTTGPQTITIDVTVDGDTKVELDESFFVNLTNLQSSGRAVTIANAQGRGTITNDDAASISIDDVTQAETDGATTFAFTVTLDAAVDAVVSMNFDTVSNTAATGDGDFTANTGGSLNFAANTTGPQTKTINVTVHGDARVELDETFFVNLTGLAAVGRTVTVADAQGLGTITNDDFATISIDDVTQTETNGATTFIFSVSLNAEVDSAITFDVATADDSATTADGDYTAMTGTGLAFAANTGGPQAMTIEVTVDGDTKVEFDEVFFLNLTNLQTAGRAVTISDNQGRGTITNDDAATVSINDVTQSETDGATTFRFTVTLDAPVDAVVSVNRDTADHSATAVDGDYTVNTGGALNFAANTAGPQTMTVDVTVTGDAKVELNEAFLVNLTGLQAAGRDVTIADGQGRGTITNDDAATISIDDVTQSETNGATTFTFTVSLDAAVDTVVGVNHNTANDTATVSDTDYTAITGGTLNFSANSIGPQTMTIDVTVNGDEKVELDEAFFVNLSNLQTAGRDVTFADAQGHGTITNDDAATISIDDVTQSETNGATTFTFTVTLDAAVDTIVSVNYDTADDSATTADADYTPTTGNALNFTANTGGSQTRTIDITVDGDTTVELDEAFFVDLSNLLAAGRDVTIADAQGRGTISNNDSATISINDVEAFEGDAGTMTLAFTVTLDAEVDTAVGVDYSTADGTASTTDTDYNAIPATGGGFVADTPSPQTFVINVVVNSDTIGELDESLFLNLSNLTASGRNIAISDAQGLGTVLNDDAGNVISGNTLFVLGGRDTITSIKLKEKKGDFSISRRGDRDAVDGAGIDRIEIQLSGGDDTVRIRFKAPIDVVVHAGAGHDTVQIKTDGNVEVRGGSGNDSIIGGSGRNTLYGEAGNDRINGGSLDDVILGGTGNDDIRGNDGNDILLGGDGNDVIRGGRGHDLVIGGFHRDFLNGERDDDLIVSSATDHDDDPAALQRILNEWTSANDVDTRIANIRIGTGATGGTQLTPGTTVIDDTATDVLKGDRDNDWLFVAIDDVVSDLPEYLDSL